MLNKKQSATETFRLIWISFLTLDSSLYKTTQIEILRHFCERGNRAYLLAMHSKQKPVSRGLNFQIDSVPMRYVPVLTPFLFATFLILFFPFYVAIRKPRVVILESDLNVLLFVWKPLLNLLGTKMILDIRSTPVELVNLRRQLSALWFNVSIIIGKNMLDGMTTLTCRMKKELCDRFKIKEDYVGVWTSGVSTSLFDPNKYDGNNMRKEFSLTDKFVVFHHGSLTMNRGILETIKALGLIREQFPDTVFFILGSGDAYPILVESALQFEVLDNVRFHSPVPYSKVPEFIAMSDVCIVPLPDLPQWRNQCPLKLLEYLAMEKTVIATNIPANQEVLGTNKCGIYVSTADPFEIAEAIAYAHTNYEKLDEWGKSGRTIVEEEYSWGKVAEQLQNYLEKLTR